MHEVQLKPKSPGVNLLVDPIFNQAAPILKTAWIMQCAECIVTSGNAGDHSKRTAHDDGRALDLRSSNLSPALWRTFGSRLAQALVTQLGPYFYLVLERDHFHLEYAPPGTKP